MFETSVIRAHALDNRKSRFSLLTVSLVAHSAVILGAIAISVASVDFPSVAPDEVAVWVAELAPVVPPPLGTPDGGKQQAVPVKQEQKQAAPPTQETAPPTVPENVIPADGPSTGTETDGPGDGKVPGPIGVDWGKEKSLGPIDGPPVIAAAPPQVENKVYTVGEVSAPVIIQRVEPVYPAVLMRTRMVGVVAVRCIIDKNGRIRDAQVLSTTMPPFADETLKALKGWRYQPATLHGQPVDCYLDLTVKFTIR